jgi:hypothetical protein
MSCIDGTNKDRLHNEGLIPVTTTKAVATTP